VTHRKKIYVTPTLIRQIRPNSIGFYLMKPLMAYSSAILTGGMLQLTSGGQICAVIPARNCSE
jgi:hypothetical protein